MFCINSYDNVNIKIKLSELKNILENIKNSEIALVQYGNISFRLFGSNLNYSIAKYQFSIWFDFLDEMVIIFDELDSIYTNESKSTIKLHFNDNYIIVIEKV